MQTSLKWMVVTAGLFCAVACKKNSKNDPTPEQPLDPGAGGEETITRVELHLTDSAHAATTLLAKFYDENGPAKLPLPTTDKLTLQASTTYWVEVKVFNDLAQPVDTISNEIEEEGQDHRFHFTFNKGMGNPSVAATITDFDEKNQPLGLHFKLKTGGEKGTGTFQVSLRHFANGLVKNEDPKGGDQDVLVDFATQVQ